jgi:restriction system protein
MAIPDYQSIMLPLLGLLSEHEPLHSAEAIARLAEHFKLTDDERTEMLPSGASTTFGSRVGWAKTYMKQAGLIDQPNRGVMRLTSRGADVLAEKPNKIDNDLLATFPEFEAFRQRSRVDKTEGKPPQPMAAQVAPASPQERVDEAMKELSASLSDEIITTVKSSSPSFFEELVVKLLLRMGYGGSREEAGRAVGRTGDGGIDGIINEDRLGLDAVYIQAKRWEGTVG